MKKATLIGLCLFTLLSLLLSACNFGVITSENDTENVAQTLVALSATQTAIAEADSQEGSVTEEIVETEEGAVTEEAMEETASPTVEVTHLVTPGEPGWIYKWFYDTDSTRNASNGYVNGGDDFIANLFERPFTETEMVYRPDVDITKAEISSDTTFYYVILTLSGPNAEGGLQAAYGVEIDEDRDGRGDLLIVANQPTSAEWAIDGVGVYRDTNNDVGGTSIMRPNSNYNGDAYDDVVFSMDVLDDPDAAWARVSTGTPSTVTLAFKKSLVNMGTFVWGVWAADSLLDPALIDLHDNFTESEAGSPYQSHSTYPLKALNLVDNTCRETFGFDATTPIAGLCYVPVAPTATPGLGSVSYVVFVDRNNDGNRDSGEELYSTGSYTVTLYEGSCGSGAVASSTDASATFSGHVAGDYCLGITPLAMNTPNQYNFTLDAGGSIYREFGVIYLY